MSAADATDEEAAYQGALRRDLERRIAEVSGYADGAFGSMRTFDALLIGCGFLLAPAVVIWLFR